MLLLSSSCVQSVNIILAHCSCIFADLKDQSFIYNPVMEVFCGCVSQWFCIFASLNCMIEEAYVIGIQFIVGGKIFGVQTLCLYSMLMNERIITMDCDASLKHQVTEVRSPNLPTG